MDVSSFQKCKIGEVASKEVFYTSLEGESNFSKVIEGSLSLKVR